MIIILSKKDRSKLYKKWVRQFSQELKKLMPTLEVNDIITIICKITADKSW